MVQAEGGDVNSLPTKDRNSDDCPLHSSWSTHGEDVVFETLWGAVAVPFGPNDEVWGDEPRPF